MKILIPTCRKLSDIIEMVDAIERTTPDCEVVVSGLSASASVNRNYCLESVCVGEVAVMLDDDIEGFYSGWADSLVLPFVDPNVVMVSARLLNPDGSFGQTCSRCYDSRPWEIPVHSNGECILPTAAIAFRHHGIRFDENYIGSGYEDSDWCHEILAAVPNARFVQSNRCQLIHRNEMKNQKGPYWKHNVMYYWTKWSKRRGNNDR